MRSRHLAAPRLALLGLSLGLAVGTVAAVAPMPVLAAAFVVNSLGDSAPVPANCVSGSGTCTLRAAVMAADAASGPSTIALATGTYNLTIPRSGGTDNASEGDLDITKNITITGAGQASTIIDAAGMKTSGGQDRAFKVAASGVLTMSSLTVKKGSTPGGNTALSGEGGGILSSGTLNLTDVTVSDNTATKWGGGMEQRGSGATAVTNLLRTTVTRNHAVSDGGGVMEEGTGNTVNISNSHVDGNRGDSFAGGVEESGGTVNITANSTVNRNHGGDVGGVYETGAGTVNISDTVIDSNTTDRQAGGVNEDGSGSLHMRNVVVSNNVAAQSPGGIYLDGGSGCALCNGSTVTIDHVTITGNKAGTQSGGGLLEDGSDVFTLTNSTISNNTAPAAAGIYLDGGSPSVIITNVTISGNVATALGNTQNAVDGYGGGILEDGGDNTALTNVTISNNRASRHGGGLINVSGGGSPNKPASPITLVNSTVSDNTAGQGAGDIENNTPTANGGGVSVKSSIVSGGSPLNCGGTVGPTSKGYNLDSGSTCNFASAGDQSNKDPMIGPLADNGGNHLKTRALLAGSPAIDAVPGNICPPPDTDERGITRHTDACDVGAYEFVLAATTATPSPSPAIPALPKAGRSQPPLDVVPSATVVLLILGGAAASLRPRRPRPVRRTPS